MPITTLTNGMRFASARMPNLPVDAISLAVRAGSAVEGEHTRGAAHLVEHLTLARGSEDSRTGLACDFDTVGAQPMAVTGKDSTEYTVRVRSSDLAFAVRAFRGALSRPDMTRARLDAEKRTVLAELSGIRHHIERAALQTAESRLFQGTPLALAPGGTHLDIVRLNGGQVAAYWSANYRPANMDLCIVGPRRHRELLPLVCEAFGTRPSTNLDRPTPAPRSDAEPKRSVVVSGGEHATLSPVVWAFRAPVAGHSARVHAVVLAALLSSGFASMLVSELRVDNQLVYSPRAFYTGYGTGGMLTISASTSADRADEVLSRIRVVLEKVASSGFSHKQLEYAIRHVACSTQIARADQVGRLRSLASSIHYLGHVPRLDDLLRLIHSVRPTDVASLAASMLENETEILTHAAFPAEDPS